VKLLVNIRIALVALRTNMMRSVLTALGIIIGVGAVIAAVSVGRGAEIMIRDQISSLGANLLVVLPRAERGPRAGGLGSGVKLTLRDAQAIGREVGDILAVAPELRGNVQIVAGNANWSTQLSGVTPSFREVRDWEIASGRFLDQRDVDSAAKVALIGQTVRAELFGEALAVGREIRVGRTPMRVIGVLAEKGQAGFGNDQDNVVLTPISTARQRVLGERAGGAGDSVNVIYIEAAGPAAVEPARAAVTELLRLRHRVAEGEDPPFEIRSTADLQQFGNQATAIFSILLASIASISLLVGGIGIMNIMLVSVTERTREIGLRMALGAKPRDILAQFLTEATVLCIIGGAAGILLGATGARAIARFADWPATVEPGIVVIAVGFSAVFGIFFGFYPARKAARLDPIDALRFE